MSCVKQLCSALAAVPVARPCTAAAVAALHAAGHAAADELSTVDRLRAPSSSLVMACAEQKVPGACLPVLGWLAAGLRSGLPPAATQQAHEMACMLLGVVARVLPDSLQLQLVGGGAPSTAMKQKISCTLQQLGNTDALCRQLAKVATALVATTFPGDSCTTTNTNITNTTSIVFTTSNNTSSSSSTTSSLPACSSQPAVPVQQHLAMSVAWQQVCLLLETIRSFTGKDDLGPALTKSGLLQALLEGALALLAVEPAAYPQTQDVQLQLWDSLRAADQAAISLARDLGGRAAVMYWSTSDLGSCYDSAGSGTRSLKSQPWMQPLFKLQVLMLAKSQWDARHSPKHLFALRLGVPWPKEALTRAVTQMGSPCVAGDLLRQRAPGLVAHGRSNRRLREAAGGLRWEVVQEHTFGVTPDTLPLYCTTIMYYLESSRPHDDNAAAIDAQELGLLMEVAELYCLVAPYSSEWHAVEDLWGMCAAGVSCPPEELLRFAASSGEALLSIAESLAQNLLLATEGKPPGSAANSSQSLSNTSSSSGSKLSSSSGSSSSSSAINPNLTVDTWAEWAQPAVSTLALMLARQQHILGAQQRHSGGCAGAVESMLTNSSTADRLRRLLEITLRTPHALSHWVRNITHFLPEAIPALHAAASSPEGSCALLSGVTTAAKRQQVLNTSLAALVQAKGVPAAAAAGVMAAVPGAMGRALGAQLLKDPAAVMTEAYRLGVQLSALTDHLLTRAAALVDPVMAPAVAYLARGSPPGQDSRLAWLESILFVDPAELVLGGKVSTLQYRALLSAGALPVERISAELRYAVAWHHVEAVTKQAHKLTQGAAVSATGMKQLQGRSLFQKVDMDPDEAARLITKIEEVFHNRYGDKDVAPGEDSSTGANPHSGKVPLMLGVMCEAGLLQWEEMRAAGDPGQWMEAEGPATPADKYVAATAVLMACKAAGAVAQLPQLLAQVEGIMAQQPWGQAVAVEMQGPFCDVPRLLKSCSYAAEWGVLLEEVVSSYLMPEPSAEMKEVVASISRNRLGFPVLTPDTVSRLLGLMGQMDIPSPPGCTYPSCCNLEGRSEAELPVQVCSKCRRARYCCREHQVAHWKIEHKGDCLKAQAAAKQVCDVAAGKSDQGASSSV